MIQSSPPLDLLGRVQGARGSRWEPVRERVLDAGLNYLAQHPKPSLPAMVRDMEAEAGSIEVADELADWSLPMLRADAVERHDVSLQSRLDFIDKLSKQPFEVPRLGQQVRCWTLAALAECEAPFERGVAQLAMEAARPLPDVVGENVVRSGIAASLEAMALGPAPDERLAVGRILQRAVDLPALDCTERVGVGTRLLIMLRRAEGAGSNAPQLAEDGLDMMNEAHSNESRLALGELLLEGLDQMSARQHDRQFVPPLVARTRQQMSALSSPTSKLRVLAATLHEVAKLAKDPAMLRALQPEQPAGSVVREDEYVVINGIRVPRKR